MCFCLWWKKSAYLGLCSFDFPILINEVLYLLLQNEVRRIIKFKCFGRRCQTLSAAHIPYLFPVNSQMSSDMSRCKRMGMELSWGSRGSEYLKKMLPGLLPVACHSLKRTMPRWKDTLQRPFCLSKSRQLVLGTVVQRRAHRWTTAPSSRINQKPVFAKAPVFGDRPAIIDSSGSLSYKHLYNSSLGLADRISTTLNSDFGSLGGKRVSFLCANDASYTVAQWAVWMSGGTAVPLYQKHPQSELEYIISDSQSSLLVAGHSYAEILEPVAERLGLPCLTLPPTSHLGTLDGADSHKKETAITEWADRPAMIVYTSGTTGRPKGVLHTHSSIQAMVNVVFKPYWVKRNNTLTYRLLVCQQYTFINSVKG